jgi:hypothetical protein
MAAAESRSVDRRSIPPQALILGAGGAVPFVAFALAAWLAPPAFAAWAQRALINYAMVILAFVGALHWGFTMKTPGMTERERWTWMGWSIVPALAAWGAGMLPFRLAIALLVATFVVHLALDHRFAAVSGLPGWYLRLRRALTALVVASLLGAALR